MVAACEDNPMEPESRPASAIAPFGKPGSIPNKGLILFNSGSPEPQLYTVDPATKNVVQVPTGPGWFSAGSWNADYTKISYSGGLQVGLHMMNADGTGQTLLAAANGVRGSVFSPDGNYVAFIAYVGLDLQVHTVEIASGNVVQLTNLTGVGQRVSWSPDGKRILFDQGGNLFTIAPDGTDLKQLTQCPVYCNDGHFSPDGKQIAFVHGGQLARMTAAGTKLQMLTSLADPQPHWPSWSPDGKQLAYERYNGAYSHDVWVLNVANLSASAVVTSRLDDTTPSWTR